MFSTIIGTVKGSLTVLAVCTYTVLAMIPLTLVAIGKVLSPTRRVRDFFHRLLVSVVEVWSGCNNFMMTLYRGTEWDIDMPEGLDHKGHYLVTCNHQSWVDILALQKCFNRRLPVLTFFLKHELVYIPLLGFAWWALDYPFMRRYSREQVAKNPSLAGKDLERARVACERLREIPFAMMSFPEGTRFSPEKRDKTGSPYQNLLKPKVGGIGVVFYALGDRLQSMIDVTVIYPEKSEGGRAPSFWDLLTGKVSQVVVRARELEIPQHLVGRNFRKDRNIRRELEEWINRVWQEKDVLIGQSESS
jgi:1-acyl-sn-glycerol-3-phosphate acyltransferase